MGGEGLVLLCSRRLLSRYINIVVSSSGEILSAAAGVGWVFDSVFTVGLILIGPLARPLPPPVYLCG